MDEVAVCGGLFLAALVAATILPAQSEAVLVDLLLSGSFSPTLLLLGASAGNILGSVINWLLGHSIEPFRGSRWFPSRSNPWRRRSADIAGGASGRCC